MRAKKSLGQNFLESEAVIETIIETANLNDNDIVLEIGPGKGILTKRLLEEVEKVVAVEKDNNLFEKLKKLFAKEIKEGRLELINKDILKIDLGLKKYKLVANIPYYITGEILREFLSNRVQPERIVLMLQNEVVERIVAKDGKESILSISVKAYGEPKYIQKVEKENFNPKPKVDSAILLIENISKENFSEIDEKEFFDLVKIGFSQKRKFLSNNLKKVLGKNIQEIFKNAKIKPDLRAEKLGVEDWKRLKSSKKTDSH